MSHISNMVSLILYVFLICGVGCAQDGIHTIPIKKAPYQVLIVKCINRNSVVGNGAILNTKWTVTTATTAEAYKNQPHSLMIRSGNGIYNTNGGLHYIGQIIIHPDFQRASQKAGSGDIALLKLIYNFHLSLTVAPIPIASTITAEDRTVELISWPQLNGKRSKDLKVISVNTTDWITCRQMYFSQAHIALDERTVCTDHLPFKLQEGDPLIYKGQLTGLFKDEVVPDKLSLPYLYIDISGYTAWINKHINA